MLVRIINATPDTEIQVQTTQYKHRHKNTHMCTTNMFPDTDNTIKNMMSCWTQISLEQRQTMIIYYKLVILNMYCIIIGCKAGMVYKENIEVHQSSLLDAAMPLYLHEGT